MNLIKSNLPRLYCKLNKNTRLYCTSNKHYLEKIKKDNELDKIKLNNNKIDEFKSKYSEIYEKIKDIDLIDNIIYCDIMYDDVKKNVRSRVLFRERIIRLINDKKYNDDVIELIIKYVDDKCN